MRLLALLASRVFIGWPRFYLVARALSLIIGLAIGGTVSISGEVVIDLSGCFL